MGNTKTQKLVSNIGLFAVGSLGSKLISFILIPIFTKYMSTTEFGQVDLITTTINMLLPVVAFSIADAVFRFVMDKNGDKVAVFTNGMSFTGLMILMIGLAYPILIMLSVNYAKYILIYLCVGLIQSLMQNFVRGIGYTKLFAINGLLSSFVLAGIGIYRIVLQHSGVVGYLDALILSNVVSIIFLGSLAKIWQFYAISSLNKDFLTSMLKYSMPLIPNAFLWFFTNDASRFFIVGMIGLTANGLYAVATKVPTIINVFYTVFAQAWQISAVEEYEKNRNGRFFSNVLNANIGLSLVLIGTVIVFLQPMMQVFVAPDFFPAWQIVPILLLASFFSNLSGFLGTIYLATKQTIGIMKTTVLGMLVNVFLNSVLIPLLGLQGAGMGAALGFAFVTLIRLRDVHKFVRLKVSWGPLVISLMLIIFMTVVQFVSVEQGVTLYLILILSEAVLIVINIRSLLNLKNN
ncbi:lipopolysaccharide biosynthesis protein [Lactiplantibacillus paraplantarum]|uniref:lipopolysaccharide biosynthesis protein n=1 Tax=Lactiplantibacillus paraplantarum TaxID=60520 RepID=UPI0023AA5102|nr:oligosaccharide flippase family protein [Lactiplantibacillus paraplantarum]WEE34794.1 polysaccharide biosynthesis C-terminal domain-containing protein [Lactiplantibacillus paraplantarum]